MAFGVFCFLTAGNVLGQETFSKKYTIGVAGMLTQIEIWNEHYLLIGFSVPANPDYQENLTLLKVDLEGVVQTEVFFGESGEMIQPFPGVSVIDPLEDNVISATWHKLNGENRCTLYRISNELEILQQSDFYSPYFSNGNQQALPRSLAIDDVRDLYLSIDIGQPGTANDFAVFKISPEGEKLWEYVYATEADPDACYSLVAQEDGVVLGVFEYGGSSNANHIRKLIKLSGVDGEEDWNVDVATEGGIFWDMIPDDDGFIVATGIKSPNVNVTGILPRLYRTDSSGAIVWESEPVGNYSTYQWMQHIVRTTDGNYVGGAQHFEQMSDHVREEAWIIKVDTAGELMWERKYYWEEGYCQTNKIHDMKATSDGGVIFCGEARQCDEPNGPSQQGWLVKLDEYGCLVPGCHTGVTENESGERVWMRVGPNPAREEMFISLSPGPSPKERGGAPDEIRVFDMNGREIKRIRLRGEGTYAVGCADWGAGFYLVSLVSEAGEVLQSLKVVKE
jgi:hypothetical protein